MKDDDDIPLGSVSHLYPTFFFRVSYDMQQFDGPAVRYTTGVAMTCRLVSVDHRCCLRQTVRSLKYTPIEITSSIVATSGLLLWRVTLAIGRDQKSSQRSLSPGTKRPRRDCLLSPHCCRRTSWGLFRSHLQSGPDVTHVDPVVKCPNVATF